MSWRSADYDYDDAASIASVPAEDGIYTGAGFSVQTATGVRVIDPEDDRVTYEANVETLKPQAYSIGLRADDNGGMGPTAYIVQNPAEDEWYSTLRPSAGFPLPIQSDLSYAQETNDVVGDTVNEDFGYIAPVGVRNLSEKPQQLPSRESEMPAEIQQARPWDTLLGAWPWTGLKAALQRPTAATPLTFTDPVVDAMPSPTGTQGADVPNTPSYAPMPLTFRAPPEPWDTREDGYYVDSGL